MANECLISVDRLAQFRTNLLFGGAAADWLPSRATEDLFGTRLILGIAHSLDARPVLALS